MDLKYEHRDQNFHCSDGRRERHALAFPAHLHYHIEMGVLIDGRTEMRVDSRAYELEGGDLFISFPNQVHEYKTIEKEHRILFIFNPDFLPQLSKQFRSTLPVTNVIKGAMGDGEISYLMNKIADLYGTDAPNKELMIQGYLLALFGRIFGAIETYDAQSQNLQDAKILGSILKYCAQNYDQPLTLSVLERELHVSKFYISHTLSSKLNIGFNDYINSLRISQACKYLMDSDFSITEISELVGFNTLRTFNRAFIKHLGVTPTQYRAKRNDSRTISMPI